MELYTDVSGTVGYCRYFNLKWHQSRWLPHMQLIKVTGTSIEWQELFPIVVACAIRYPHFSGKLIQFWCDDESVVAIINSDHSKVVFVFLCLYTGSRGVQFELDNKESLTSLIAVIC